MPKCWKRGTGVDGVGPDASGGGRSAQGMAFTLSGTLSRICPSTPHPTPSNSTPTLHVGCKDVGTPASTNPSHLNLPTPPQPAKPVKNLENQQPPPAPVQYVKEIGDLLRTIPRPLLLLLKTNDCLRCAGNGMLCCLRVQSEGMAQAWDPLHHSLTHPPSTPPLSHLAPAERLIWRWAAQSTLLSSPRESAPVRWPATAWPTAPASGLAWQWPRTCGRWS